MSSGPDEISLLLQPSFLAEVETASLDELTVKRDACRRAAAGLAYSVHLCRAELEIVEAEAEWRSYRLDRQLSMLADTFAASLAVLAGEAEGDADAVAIATTTGQDDALSGLEGLIGSAGISGDVTAAVAAVHLLSDEQVAKRAEAVRSRSAAAQSRKAALRQTVDRLDAEIAARYRAGDADVAVQPPDKDRDDAGR